MPVHQRVSTFVMCAERGACICHLPSGVLQTVAEYSTPRLARLVDIWSLCRSETAACFRSTAGVEVVLYKSGPNWFHASVNGKWPNHVFWPHMEAWSPQSQFYAEADFKLMPLITCDAFWDWRVAWDSECDTAILWSTESYVLQRFGITLCPDGSAIVAMKANNLQLDANGITLIPRSE
eukprot:TRINITY_DN6663_c0_g1_i1.p1 TRINITY_DN6663_c0_g1~~TRINITY_DN6663_c0_g1_i1.p1  ORF type:complete len:179 (+),score=11.09 TRINITY_DN6663_c0_g1_i1:75-611(+)